MSDRENIRRTVEWQNTPSQGEYNNVSSEHVLAPNQFQQTSPQRAKRLSVPTPRAHPPATKTI
jgi:hypothetical protein